MPLEDGAIATGDPFGNEEDNNQNERTAGEEL
jgi:hypothetical protein